MIRKDFVLYAVLIVLALLSLWQFVSNGYLKNQIYVLGNHEMQMQKYNEQLQLLSGIGQLKSTHMHADVKVYVGGKPVDFSQKKYQLATSYIHFEEGIGEVIHVHATGLTLGHLFNSLGLGINSKCVSFENQNYCSDSGKKLRLYVNGKLNDEYGSYTLQDLDKILVSYGNDAQPEIQKHLNSITNLAPKLSGKA